MDLHVPVSCYLFLFQGLAAKLNLGAAVLNIHRYAAQITGHFPSEIVFPLALVTTGFAVRIFERIIVMYMYVASLKLARRNSINYYFIIIYCISFI